MERFGLGNRRAQNRQIQAISRQKPNEINAGTARAKFKICGVLEEGEMTEIMLALGALNYTQAREEYEAARRKHQAQRDEFIARELYTLIP
jgi:hypothetical protein